MSLIKVADVTKKILLVVLAILVILLVARIVVSISEKVSETLITRYSVQTRGFGDLPSLNLKQIEGADNHNPTFTIETLSGELPEINTLFNVYRIDQPEVELSSEVFAREVADDLEFIGEPQKFSRVDWAWAHLDKTIEIDIQTGHFIYKNASPQIDTNNSEPAENPSGHLTSILSRLGYTLPDDTEFEIEYFNYTDNKYIHTPDTSAPWIRVSMYSTLDHSVDNPARISSPDYIPTTTYIIAPNIDSVPIESIAELAHYGWSPEDETMQTYNGITAEKAYEGLQEGNGALVYAVYPKKAGSPDVSQINNVRITEVIVGYYTSEANILYFQPIYIFYGASGEEDNRVDLVYYVSAIR